MPDDEGGVQAASAEVERCRLAAREAAGTERAAPLSQELARALVQMAELLMLGLESAAATGPATEAVEVAGHLVERDPDAHRPVLIAALEALHVPLYVEGRIADAAATARALVTQLRLQDPAGLPDHGRRFAGALRELGDFELKQGDPGAAIDALRESVERYAVLAETDPAYVGYRNNVEGELNRAVERRYLFMNVEVAARGGIEDEERVLVEIPYLCPGDGELAATLATYARQQFEEQRTRQAGWTGPTRNDAIDRAFEDLNARGVVALQDAGSTMSGGWSAVHEAASNRDDARGAVFYHRQDLERALGGGGLWLAFGALTDDDRQTVAIGHEIRAALESHGVPVAWTGTAGDRLEIPPFEWRKRR